MKIAVVGSGIAGLSAAWALAQEHDVTVYEAHAHAGMDAHAVHFEHEGKSHSVDMPMRVFFEAYYPTLSALYRHVGIESETINYAASFSGLEGPLYFQYDNAKLAGRRIPMLTGPALRHLSSLKLGVELVRFFRSLEDELSRPELSAWTLSQFLSARGYSHEFAEHFLVPAYAGICTCSCEAVRSYPARVILDYLGSGLVLAGMKKVSGGTREVVDKLTGKVSALHLSSPVQSVTRVKDGVQLKAQGHAEQVFDHVVFATQANQALGILKDASDKEMRTLRSFEYEKSEVLMHTDPKLAPKEQKWWSPVNYLLESGAVAPMATIWMNPIQPELGTTPVFQTWNPLISPDEDKVIARAHMQRPVVNDASMRGLVMLQGLHKDEERNVWFVGSYAKEGIPLLESAAKSALELGRYLNRVDPAELL